MKTNLYDRQRSLGLNIPPKVAIIGVGGVGAWCALNFALTGTKEIFLIDDDILEEHNLNRTPFKRSQIGKTKVVAMTELIIERRIDAKVMPIPLKIENLDKNLFDKIKNAEIIDCRDTSEVLPEGLKSKITGGYNGISITLHVNPEPGKVWTAIENQGYTITPSYLVPPVIIAALITDFIIGNYQLDKDEFETFNLNEILPMILGRKKTN